MTLYMHGWMIRTEFGRCNTGYHKLLLIALSIWMDDRVQGDKVQN